MGLDVTSRARVAIVEPRTADSGPFFQDDEVLDTGLHQLDTGADPTRSGPDDDDAPVGTRRWGSHGESHW